MVTREQSTAEIIDELVAQAVHALARRDQARTGAARVRRGGVMEPSAAVPGSRRVLRRLRDTMAGSGTAQQRLDAVVHIDRRRDGGGGVLHLRDARGRGARALRHRGLASRGRAPHPAPRRRGAGRRHRRDRAAPGARRRAVASRFRLPARDRRGDLPLAPGRAGACAAGACSACWWCRTAPCATTTEDEVETLQTIAMILAELVASGELVNPLGAAPTEGIGMLPVRLEGVRIHGGLAIGAAVLHEPRIVIRQVVAENPQAELERLRRAVAAMQQRDRRAHRSRRPTSCEGGEHARHSRKLSHVRRRPRLAPAHHRGGAQRPHRRGRGAEGPGRDRMRGCRRRAIPICASGSSISRISPTACSSTSPAARSPPPPPRCPTNSSSSRAAWGRPSCSITTGSASRAWCSRKARPRRMSRSSRARSTFPWWGGSTTCSTGSRPATSSRSTARRRWCWCGRARTCSRRSSGASSVRRGDRQRYRRAARPAGRDARRRARRACSSIPGCSSTCRSSTRPAPRASVSSAPSCNTCCATASPRSRSRTLLYRRVLEHAGDRPVTFRTLDVGGDKLLPYMPDSADENPAMGWRAIRIALDRPALLRQQLRALIRAAAGRRLRVMFPMIAEVAELEAARAILELELERAVAARLRPAAGLDRGRRHAGGAVAAVAARHAAAAKSISCRSAPTT